MSIGGGKGSDRNRTTAEIPEFLYPLLHDAAGSGRQALSNVNHLLHMGNDPVANFTSPQLQAQALALTRARGAGDFFSTAQDVFRDTAQGVGINEYLPGYSTLQGAAGGTGLDSFIPGQALSTLNQGAAGMNVRGTGVLQQGAQGMHVPGMGNLAGQQNGQLPGQVTNTLSQFARNNSLPPEAMQALTRFTRDRDIDGVNSLSALQGQQGVSDDVRASLQSTMAGDYLHGGDAFQAAVDAAVRSAQPHVISAFGGAGRGTGGLAQTAIAQAGIDAFARQYGQERANQLAAANALGEFGLAERGQSADIASRLADIDLTGRGQQIGAASTLGQLGLAGGNQQIGAAQGLGQLNLANRGLNADISQALASLGLQRNDQRLGAAQALAGVDLSRNAQRIGAANSLASLGDAERSRALSAAGLLGQFGMQERGNQLNAAAMLPELAMADVNVMNQVGQTQQDQAQREIDGRINAQLQRLAAALGILPSDSLIGQDSRGSRRGFEFGIN